MLSPGVIGLSIGDLSTVLQGLFAVYSVLDARKENVETLRLILDRCTVLYEVLAKTPEGTHERAVQHLYDALASVKQAADEYQQASSFKRFLFAVDYQDTLLAASNKISAVAADLNLSLAADQIIKLNAISDEMQAAIVRRLQQVLDEQSTTLFHRLDLHLRDVPEALAALNQRLEKSEARATQLEKQLHETLLHIRASVVRNTNLQQPAPCAEAKQLGRLAVTSYDFEFADPSKTPLLGKGSFGEVVRAVWKATGTKVAIKRLVAFQGCTMARDQTATQLVAKEALVWSGLQHPHVIPLLGVSLQADVPFLVMSLMAGGDLPWYTKDKSPQVQLHALHQAAQGVAYLHSQKIFHGDLKGNNVLVDEFGRVQVSDFGQSRILSMAGTRISTFNRGSVGNVRWIAPERYEHGAKYQFEPDVFGFAVIMYEVLSGGKLPFQDDWKATDDLIREWYCQGVRPTLPSGCLDQFQPANIWGLVEDCWQQQWLMRPTMVTVVRRLDALSSQLQRFTATASTPASMASLPVFSAQVSHLTTVQQPFSDSAVADMKHIHSWFEQDQAMAYSLKGIPNPETGAWAKTGSSEEMGELLASMKALAVSDRNQSSGGFKSPLGGVFAQSRKKDPLGQHVSGCHTKPKPEVQHCADPKRIVVAIDFGTSHSGYAFGKDGLYEALGNPAMARHIGSLIHVRDDWPGATERYPKTLSAMLFDYDGQPVAYGDLALAKYLELRGKAIEQYALVRRIKLLLADDSSYNDPFVKESHLEPTQIIADFLTYLKCDVEEQLKRAGYKLGNGCSINWVLTIPAMWTDSAKASMAAATKLCGLLDNGGQVVFCLEPEAALLNCAIATNLIKHGDCVLVVDMGGGTVDLAAFQVLHAADRSTWHGLKFDMITPSDGCTSGATVFDDAFYEFFCRLIGVGSIDSIDPASKVHLFHEWERVKRTFTGPSDPPWWIKLDRMLQRKLSDEKVAKLAGQNRYDPDRGEVRVLPDDIIKCFNKVYPSILAITMHMLSTAKVAGKDINKLLCVGGFAEMRYMQQQVQETFGSHDMDVIFPLDSGASIVQGALLYGMCPDSVQSQENHKA